MVVDEAILDQNDRQTSSLLEYHCLLEIQMPGKQTINVSKQYSLMLMAIVHIVGSIRQVKLGKGEGRVNSTCGELSIMITRDKSRPRTDKSLR